MNCKYSSIKIGAWNIEGAYFKVNNFYVNKLRENEFLENSKIHDILCVQETHCGPRDVPSQHLNEFCSIPHCKKISSNNRFFGGMLLLVRKTIRKGVKISYTDDPDILGITLKKDFFNFTEDLHTWFVYASPASSPYAKYRGNTILKLEDLLAQNATSQHIIMGDLNGRTARVEDFITNKYNPFLQSHDIPAHSFLIPPRRRNIDKQKTDEHGKMIIDMCKSFQIRIMNGRISGDRWGKPTRYPINRAEKPSTIDYGICSHSLLPLVKSFYVQPFSTLSDHCCISMRLKTSFFSESMHTIEKRQDKSVVPSFQLSRLSKYQLCLKNDSRFKKLESSIYNLEKLKGPITQERIDCWVTTFNEAIIDNAGKSFSHKKIYSKQQKNKKREPAKPAKWYNSQCQNAKENLKRAVKRLNKDPYNRFLQENQIHKRKIYKKACKEAEIEHRKHVMDTLLTTKDPKKFWKIIKDMKRYGQETEDPSDSIAPSTWEKYFKDLLNTKINRKEDTTDIQNPPLLCSALNVNIKMKELEAALRKIKIGKAHGPDGIIAEYVKYATPNVITTLLAIMNTIFINSIYPTRWTVNFLKAIYKSGPIEEPGNYRGLAIGPAIAKLYSLVLLARLEKYILDNKILTKNQIGFIRGFRTADHIYVLKTIITKYTKNGGKLYAAFIDFKKAYDKVNRDTLLRSLNKHGIKGRIFSNIKALYSRVEYSIRTTNRTLDPISSNLGLKQGCPLSPILFNLYINDMSSHFKTNNITDKVILQGEELSHFLYADDLVIISKSKAGLQEKLNGLSTFAKEKDLTINIKKSKIMVFNQNGKTLKGEYCLINGQKLDVVSKYTYLGVDIPSSGSFSTSIRELTDKAKRAMMSLFSTIMRFNFPFRKSIQLFGTYVEPILFYNSENQSALTDKQIDKCKRSKTHIYDIAIKSPITTTQLKFMKFVMGVGKHCPNMVVFGESATLPLQIKAYIHMLNFWNRVKEMENQTLVKMAYKENLAMNTNWCKTIQVLNSSFNLHSKHINPKIFPNVMKKKITSDFIKYWKNRISNPEMEKKLSLYSDIKQKFDIEPYMNLPFRDRQIISKIVGSSHTLQIETGRHRDIPREDRLCKICDLKQVEDEEHFMTECPAYNKIRLDFFGKEKLIAKKMLLEIDPAIMAAFLRSIYRKRQKLVEEKPQEYHLVRHDIMKYTFIKGPKKIHQVQNISKDGFKMKITLK